MTKEEGIYETVMPKPKRSSRNWELKKYKIPTSHFQNRNMMAYKESTRNNNNKKHACPSRKEKCTS